MIIGTFPRVCAGAVILAATVAQPAPSARADERPAFELPPVIASASRLAAGLASSSVTVIGRDAIARHPGRTLPDVLAAEAGLHVRDFYGNGAASFATVDIRGFGEQATQNTLILVDGRRINDFDLSGVQTSLVPRDAIERIEVVRGAAASVLYGEGAVGGAVNIVTRGGAPDPGVSLAASAGSFDYRRLQGSFRYGEGPVHIALAGDATNADGYRENNELIRQTYRALAAFDAGRTHWQAAAGYNTEKIGLPGARLIDTGTGLDELRSDRRGTSEPFNEAEERGFRLEGGAETALADGLDLIVDAGFRRSLTSSDFVAQFRLDDRVLSTVTLTPRVLASGSLFGRAAEVIAGLDLTHTDAEVTQRFIGFPGGNDFDGWQSSAALFAQGDVAVTDRLTLDAGVRLIRTEVELTSPQNPAARVREGETQVAANLGAAFQVTREATLFARGGRAVRVPTIDERVGTRLDPVTFLPLSFGLDTQTSWDIEAGVRVARGPVDLRVAAFQMHVDDQIAFTPDTIATFGFNTNLDGTRRRGVEAEGALRLGHGITVSPRVTWTDAVFTDGPFEGNDVPAVPSLIGGVGAVWRGEHLWASADWRYVGAQRMLNDQGAAFPEIPSYQLTDLAAGATFGPVGIAAELRNAFDEDYYAIAIASDTNPNRYATYPLPGRAAFVEVSLAF